jgi:hypothetical protein
MGDIKHGCLEVWRRVVAVWAQFEEGIAKLAKLHVLEKGVPAHGQERPQQQQQHCVD